jgi:hypothetical protein
MTFDLERESASLLAALVSNVPEGLSTGRLVPESEERNI